MLEGNLVNISGQAGLCLIISLMSFTKYGGFRIAIYGSLGLAIMDGWVVDDLGGVELDVNKLDKDEPSKDDPETNKSLYALKDM
jgi:hypothetical protein